MDESAELAELWRVKAHERPQSVCRTLVKDLLGLSEAQYKAIRHEFNGRESDDLVGIYKAKKGHDVADIALAIRVPDDGYKWATLAAGFGAIGTALGVSYMAKRRWFGDSTNVTTGGPDFEDENFQVVSSPTQERESLKHRLETTLQPAAFPPKSRSLSDELGGNHIKGLKLAPHSAKMGQDTSIKQVAPRPIAVKGGSKERQWSTKRQVWN